MILAYDTETTGYVNTRQPPSDPGQPHLVQLGCVLYDDEGVERGVVDLIIKPEGYEIPEQAARVHGITTEIAERCGVPLITALSAWTNLRAKADRMVAHNKEFDKLVMLSAIHRSRRQPFHPGPPDNAHDCTMSLARPVVKLPPTAKMVAAGFNTYKAPTLGECYQHFFGEPLVGAHSALVDARACGRVYLHLLSLGAVA